MRSSKERGQANEPERRPLAGRQQLQSVVQAYCRGVRELLGLLLSKVRSCCWQHVWGGGGVWWWALVEAKLRLFYQGFN